MEYRQLGASGFKVPVLSLGTGTFGGGTISSRPGAPATSPRRRGWSTSASRPASPCSTRPTSTPTGMAEEILGQAIKGRRDQVIISTKGTFRVGRRAKRRRARRAIT